MRASKKTRFVFCILRTKDNRQKGPAQVTALPLKPQAKKKINIACERFDINLRDFMSKTFAVEQQHIEKPRCRTQRGSASWNESAFHYPGLFQGISE
jgi:hypothetical protein